MFYNAVDPISSLQAVKNQADKSKIQKCTALTYEQYSELRISSAMTYDENLIWTISLDLNHRGVCMKLDSL